MASKFVVVKNAVEHLDAADWPRRQEAGIDRVLGGLDILSAGVGVAWVEIPEEQVSRLRPPLCYEVQDDQPAALVDQLGVYDLFTLSERGRIFLAAQTNGVIAAFLAMLRDAKDGIHLDHPDFVAGVSYLGTEEALGADALTAERVAAVLAGSLPS